jgi:hypothetical protein
LVYTPAVFVRVANNGLRAYGTWKNVRKTGGREETAERNEEANSQKLKVEGKRRI